MAILTAFIIEVWKTLEEDTAATSAQLLRRISLQLANESLATAPLPSPAFNIGDVLSVAFAPHGVHLVSGAEDHTVRVWDVSTGKPLRSFEGHTGDINAVCFTPDATQIVSGSHDHTINFWDANVGIGVTTLGDAHPQRQPFLISPNGAYVLATPSLTKDRTGPEIWSIDTGEMVSSLKPEGRSRGALFYAFSQNCVLLATGHQLSGTVRLWDVSSGKEHLELKGPDDWIRSVAFSPDGTHVVSGSDDRTVRVWDVTSGDCMHTLEGHTAWVHCVTYSSNGAYSASASRDGSAHIWNAATGHIYKTLRHHAAKAVLSLGFSPSGKRITSGSADKIVYVWDVETESMIKTLRGSTSTIKSVSFSSDGAYITSVGENDDSETQTWRSPSDFPLEPDLDLPLPLATPIFEFDSQSGWILGRRDAQGDRRRLFWVVPHRRPKHDKLLTLGHKVLLTSATGLVTVLNLACAFDSPQ